MLDFLRQMGTMKKMKTQIDKINTETTRTSEYITSGALDGSLSSSEPAREVVMKPKSGLVAGLIVGLAVAAGLLTSAVAMHNGKVATDTGLMPEVTVTAEMPRLVMDTVFVTAVQHVAAIPAADVIY